MRTLENTKTFNVIFNSEDSSNDKGFEQSFECCHYYIQKYNGTNESYFQDYKGGVVSIICNETGKVVFETAVK